MNTKNFVAIGLGIALLVSILAPFLASSNPDGLESVAEKFEDSEGKDYQAFNSPFPDYSIPSLGETGTSGALAIVIGTFITFGIGYWLRSHKSNKKSRYSCT
jgi:cobalt/nickel transport protein